MPQKYSRNVGRNFFSQRVFKKNSLQRRLGFESLEDRRMLAVATVDTHLDIVDQNDDFTSLREAIAYTNLLEGPDTIEFANSLLGETIHLTQGEMEISDSLTITGPGAELLTIDASGSDPTPNSTPLDDDFSDDADGSRIFRITGGIVTTYIYANSTPETPEPHVVEISGLSLTGGDSYRGGAIYTLAESLTLRDVSVYDNYASVEEGRGGGISARFGNDNSLNIISSEIRGNIAQRQGGGIDVEGDGQLSIVDTDISNNKAGSAGGGIRSHRPNVLIQSSYISNNSSRYDGGGVNVSVIFTGSLRIDSSTISNNTSEDDGGGIAFTGYRTGGGYYPGPFELVSSTVSGNSAVDDGGAIRIVGESDVFIEHSTIYNNSSGVGGAVHFSHSSLFQINHSIIAGNKSDIGPADLGGTLEYDDVRLNLNLDLHYSLIGDNKDTDLTEAPVGSPDANGNLIGGVEFGMINPLLGPLADNGDDTLTHALLPGSPAIDAGDPLLVPGLGGAPEYDQRGNPFSRVVGSAADIGAIESTQLAVDSIGVLKDTLLGLDESNKTKRILSKHLDRAIRKLGDANPFNDWAAIIQLKVFSAKVRYLQGRRIDSADADLLLDVADRIVTDIRDEVFRPWFGGG